MEGQWQVVKPQQIPALAAKAEAWGCVLLDTETTGANPYLGARPIGLGLGPFDEEKYYYLPLLNLNELDVAPIIRVLERKNLMGHNIKFDLHMLRTLGWHPEPQTSFIDTIVMARLWATEEHPQLGLKELSKQIFNYEYEDPQVVKIAKAGKLAEIDPALAGHYCCEDLWLTKRLYKWLKAELPLSLLKLFTREIQLTRDLFEMECRGILIDQEYLGFAVERLDRELQDLLQRISSATDMPKFNPRSPDQLKVLMNTLNIKPVRSTPPSVRKPQGDVSWNRDALMAVRAKHPVAMLVAKQRALAYQRSGTIARCLDYINAGNQELHFEFKNWGTVTGRLSGDGQQLPKGWLQFGSVDESGEEVLVWAKGPEQEFSLRRLLRPRPGHMLFKADYGQIEMFVLGSYMHDPTFTAWLDSGNVHAAAALEIWGDAEEYYARGKVYNFATVYGQGDKSRAKSLNCTLAEAAQYREDYNLRMPGHKRFLRRVERLLQRDGYIENVYGRRYYLDSHLAYKGVNYACQGSAGDFVKFKLPETRKLRQQIGMHMLITTHDDFVPEIPEENIKYLPDWLAELRKSPFGRDLELDVEYSRDSLVQLHPLEELISV